MRWHGYGLRTPEEPARVRAEASWLAAPMRLAGHVVAVGAAIGLAVVDRPHHLSELLRRADRAMYRAKGIGGPAALLWGPNLDGDGGVGGQDRPGLRTRDLRRLTRQRSGPLPIQASRSAEVAGATPVAAVDHAGVPVGVGG